MTLCICNIAINKYVGSVYSQDCMDKGGVFCFVLFFLPADLKEHKALSGKF